MVLFLKRIPNPIGIWNAEYSRHRNKGDKRLPLVLFFIEWSFLDTAPESFLYWWRHHFIDPLPLSSNVIILQPPNGGDVICGCPLNTFFVNVNSLISACRLQAPHKKTKSRIYTNTFIKSKYNLQQRNHPCSSYFPLNPFFGYPICHHYLVC